MRIPQDDLPDGIIPIRELEETGILQEINRLFFHPLGLHLEPHANEGAQHLVVSDYRQDGEGCVMREVDEKLVSQVRALFKFREEERKMRCNWVVQPVGPLQIKAKSDILWIPKV